MDIEPILKNADLEIDYNNKNTIHPEKSRTIKLLNRGQFLDISLASRFGEFGKRDFECLFQLFNKIKIHDSARNYLNPESIQRKYFITESEFPDLFAGANQDNSVLDNLMGIILHLVEPDALTSIKLCESTEYRLSEGYAKIKLTDTVLPYLEALIKIAYYNYLSLNNFKKLHTERFYQFILRHQKDKKIAIKLDELEAELATFALNYRSFKRNILQPSIAEIKEKKGIDINFERKPKKIHIYF